MTDVATRTAETYRLFLAVPIPERARSVIRRAMTYYEDSIERFIPEERWHMTLLFLGESPDPTGYLPRITKPLTQAYVPTLTLTHVGRGVTGRQLWVYAAATPLVEKIRSDIADRFKQMRFAAPGLKEDRPFVPHIHVADLATQSRQSLADESATITFNIPAIHIYRSEQGEKGVQYTSLRTIPL